ncbi:hypothetical protein CHS0354_025957 [Potamilus streckersoni]|uniref:Uncharacterized protein n=1 Tax=Potamilus streckersoni TaxID=2493646 RepID=A0AAE0T3Y4_9BIVA|nr:hypothetical protein CHS0354_025957 [Potamilus streckersoni]
MARCSANFPECCMSVSNPIQFGQAETKAEQVFVYQLVKTLKIRPESRPTYKDLLREGDLVKKVESVILSGALPKEQPHRNH